MKGNVMEDLPLGCWIVVALAVLVLLIATPIMSYGSVDSFVGLYVKSQIDRGNTYFVIKNIQTGEQEVYGNEDSLLFLKFDSGDLLMELEPGRTYQFKVNWFRVPLFSMYRNVLAAEEVSE